MFQDLKETLLNNDKWIADNNPVPHKLVVNGTDVSLEVQPKGCWNIIDKNQLIVCNNLLTYSQIKQLYFR